MFVLRLTDPKSKSFLYLTKIGPTGASPVGFFGNDEALFDTEQEAIDYIETLLASGWYRDDISKKDFTAVPLIWSDGFWETEEVHLRHHTPNPAVQKLIEDLIAFRDKNGH